jgi:hypothetical protein
MIIWTFRAYVLTLAFRVWTCGTAWNGCTIVSQSMNQFADLMETNVTVNLMSRILFDHLDSLRHNCRSLDPPLVWIFGSVAAGVLFLVIITITVYKSWAYEQELDSLMWKIDAKDVVMSQVQVTSKNKVCRVAP